MIYIGQYFTELYRLFIEMAPYLLLGFFFAGLLHIYMPEDSVRKYMGGKNLKSVFNAALLGVPLPLCSCGVIPTGIAFHKEGASKGSTVSFLISTPQTGVDSILATYSLLGLPFAILRPVIAFFSGIIGGVATNAATKNDPDPHQPFAQNLLEPKIKNHKIISMFRYAFHDFLMDIAKWLIIGLSLAAFLSVILPDNFFTLYLDNQYLSMLIVLAASVPLYVCATGSIPIAAVLMMKGLSPGAALVFLMAGPATNAATIALIGKAIDKKTLFVYLGSIIGSALFFGWLTNNVLPQSWFTLAFHDMNAMQEHGFLPYWLKAGSGILLLLLLINGYISKLFKRKESENTTIDMSSQIEKMKITVEGMTCNHCKMNVEKSILNLEGIESVVADPDRSEVILQGENIDLEKIKLAVESIGYDYKGIKN